MAALSVQPSKTCECGCGQVTSLATETDSRRGHVKGQPVRFLPFHHHRVRSQTENCTITGCRNQHHARGWCEKHYRRWQKTGSPDVVRGNPTAARPLRERLAERIDKTASNGCWVWTGSLNNSGYGLFTHLGRRSYAHRLMYELERGAIPVGLQIDHLCRNRACCNPAHLEPVTGGENTRRGVAPSALFNRTGRCQRGHDVSVVGVYATPKGKQQCRGCSRLRQQRRRAGARSTSSESSATTHPCARCGAPLPPNAGFCKACAGPIGQ